MPKSLMRNYNIESKIFLIRNQKVMLDFDLASLYDVETRVLKQAVRRNSERFPADFMFQLTKNEWFELITNCDKLNNLKYSPSLPFAFTEQGVAMLSTVLKSRKAILVNIEIMRAFVKIREIISTHKELAARLKELELKVDSQDASIAKIFEVIRQMLEPSNQRKRRIGF